MKLFVTGVSGFAGSRVAVAAAAAGHEVIGTWQTAPFTLRGVRAFALDLREPDAIATAVRVHRPDAVLHLAAMARPSECAAEPARAHAVNVLGALQLARASWNAGAHFVAVSSDLVFDGKQGWYREEDPTSPLGEYASTKAELESHLAGSAADGSTTMVRLALTYGNTATGGRCFAEELLALLRAGKPVRAFVDQHRTPLYVEDLAEALLYFAKQRTTGVYNLAGPDRLSRYEIATKLARAYGLERSLVVSTRSAEVTFGEPRPSDVSLLTQKLTTETPLRPRGVEAGFFAMRALERESPRPPRAPFVDDAEPVEE